MANQNTYAMFGVKYFFRFLHMISFAILFGNITYDLFIKRRVTSNDKIKGKTESLNNLFYVVAIVSGLVNMILLIIEKKFHKDFNYGVWKKSLIMKFLLTLLITPLLDSLISMGVQGADKVDSITIPIKFTIMLLFTLGSPFLRYYRENYMTSTTESNNIK